MKNDHDPRDYRSPQDSPEVAAVPFEPPPPPPMSPVDEAIARNQERLLAIDGVEGFDHGRAADGTDAVRVYVRDESVRERVPRELDGFPVLTVVSGPFEAF
ncbi:hypothetical protein [Spirillospora sp. NPDC029432]|uniref:hypothetical protein n=1 Tax=Spirillospora sp. NPDC029432 TaxID=3154599 RepID=UPI0034511451